MKKLVQLLGVITLTGTSVITAVSIQSYNSTLDKEPQAQIVKKETIENILQESVSELSLSEEEIINNLENALNDIPGIEKTEIKLEESFSTIEQEFNVKVSLAKNFKWNQENFEGIFKVKASFDDTSKILNHLENVKQKIIIWFAEKYFDARKWVGTYPNDASLSKSKYTFELYDYLEIEDDSYIKDIEHFSSSIEQANNSNQFDDNSIYNIVIIPEDTVDKSNNSFDEVLKPFAINFNKQTIEDALENKTIEVNTFIGKNDKELITEIENILKKNNENIKWDIIDFSLDINKYPYIIHLTPSNKETFFYKPDPIKLEVSYLEIPAITNNLKFVEVKNRKIDNESKLLIEIKQTLIDIDERLNDDNVEIILTCGIETIQEVQTEVFTNFEVKALQNSKLKGSKTFDIIDQRKSIDVVLSNLNEVEVNDISIAAHTTNLNKVRDAISQIDSDLTKDDQVELVMIQGTVDGNLICKAVKVRAKPNSKKYISEHLVKLVLTNNLN
ncbi:MULTISPECIES: hypothetical protein [Mesoplasma]|uniref:Uncharacterized protein n=1 Tax=Mesoplasma florum TaxID=2151 RepID=A0A2R3P7N0_MESFO|nr:MULTISPECIES: hypothetical protein [Mesoplasma]AVN64484.1 hypothetical protein CG003_02305 [Mesoplasma florum]